MDVPETQSAQNIRHQPEEGRHEDHDGDWQETRWNLHRELLVLPGECVQFGNRSQNKKESFRTISPRRTEISQSNRGPAQAYEWNSPFSPHGSTSSGSSSRNRRSISRPTNESSSLRVSMQQVMERNPRARKVSISSRVSRFQMGKIARMPSFARFRSRYSRRSSRKISPNA